jgi:hypothetical protein
MLEMLKRRRFPPDTLVERGNTRGCDVWMCSVHGGRFDRLIFMLGDGALSFKRPLSVGWW